MPLLTKMKTTILLLVSLIPIFTIHIGLSHAQSDPQLTSGENRFGNTGSKMDPSDLPTDNTTTFSNPQMVIKILSLMTPDKIQKFPLKDLPTDELLIVLNGLTIKDLFKTLDNIPAADLAEIFNELPQDKSQGILNRLPPDESQEILDRITGELSK
jgi:hypothetical protein